MNGWLAIGLPPNPQSYGSPAGFLLVLFFALVIIAAFKSR